MSELDEAIVRPHMRRRAGGSLSAAEVDRLTGSVMSGLDGGRSSWLGGLRAIPISARVGVAAGLVLAISLIAVPLVSGPRASTAPPPATTTATSNATTSGDPGALRVLSLAELQRVVALGDSPAYRDQIVVADVDVAPYPTPLTCLPGDCRLGVVDAADPTIVVAEPADDRDILITRVGQGVTGPVVLRIQAADRVELIGQATDAAGGVVWQLRSFITAVDELPRTMELSNRTTFGPAFVVDAKLALGDTFFCTMETPSTDRIALFACGQTAWLAPSDVADPAAVIDGWSGRPPDWVRVQDGAFPQFVPQPQGDQSTPNIAAVRGFYVVFPLIKYDANLCFQCDAGAVAMLYARLEPVPIP